MHGSILPKLTLPLLAVAGWASLITAISMTVRDRKPPALTPVPVAVGVLKAN